MIVRKELYNGIRYPEGKYSEDRFVLFKITSSCKKGIIINRRFYKYLQREGSICHTNSYKKWADAAESEGERLRFIHNSGMFNSSEKRKVARRSAKLLIRNLRHTILLTDGSNRIRTINLCKGIGLIPRGTVLGPRILFIRRRIKNYLKENQE